MATTLTNLSLAPRKKYLNGYITPATGYMIPVVSGSPE